MSGEKRPMFVLRWESGGKCEWASLSAVTESCRRPVFLRFVDLGGEPVAEELFRAAVLNADGMYEVWFRGPVSRGRVSRGRVLAEPCSFHRPDQG